MSLADQARAGFERHWRFRAQPGREEEFEAVYGVGGAWATLFSQAAGYRGTAIDVVPGSRGEYLIVDRWDSRAAWEGFLRDHAEEYERLDRECAPLTAMERLEREVTA